MKFTRRTYHAAMRRAFRIERQCFYDHLRACRGPEAWHKQYRFLNRLIERRTRERKWWF